MKCKFCGECHSTEIRRVEMPEAWAVPYDADLAAEDRLSAPSLDWYWTCKHCGTSNGGDK